MNRWFDNLPIIGNKIPGKITLSFLMFLFAICMELIFKTVDRLFCVFAMTFSFLGDIALNHKKNHDEQSKKDFILGGISFVVAHFCYCIAYYKKIQINNYTVFNIGSVLAIIILIATTFLTVITSIEKEQKLIIFGIAYLWLTGINYTTIFSYAFSVKSVESLAALGGVLFLASDVIIGLEKFSGLKSKLARNLVWYLYPLGQIILIALA